MRPKGWGKIKQSILEEPNGMDTFCCSVCGDKVVELAASAMLEGLKKEGCWITSRHSSKINFTDDNYIESSPLMAFIKGQRKAGYLVFIPEEKR